MPRWMYDDGEDGLKMHLVKINSVHAMFKNSYLGYQAKSLKDLLI